ncbi:hypothetical protein ANN_22129 [Periplaneta americana]|uniref:Uncharacterized protein n=1 Tax=Periplaneta americana TaxID=6978 RepID=A0ABQ8S7F9_PERAM|nr:hypothetical protein ANN_22129 [Periplaneta americana]
MPYRIVRPICGNRLGPTDNLNDIRESDADRQAILPGPYRDVDCETAERSEVLVLLRYRVGRHRTLTTWICGHSLSVIVLCTVGSPPVRGFGDEGLRYERNTDFACSELLSHKKGQSALTTVSNEITRIMSSFRETRSVGNKKKKKKKKKRKRRPCMLTETKLEEESLALQRSQTKQDKTEPYAIRFMTS